MKESSVKVTFAGNPLTLLGNEIKVGDKAPDFTAVRRIKPFVQEQPSAYYSKS